jgi:hypothetical protein
MLWLISLNPQKGVILIEPIHITVEVVAVVGTLMLIAKMAMAMAMIAKMVVVDIQIVSMTMEVVMVVVVVIPEVVVVKPLVVDVGVAEDHISTLKLYVVTVERMVTLPLSATTHVAYANPRLIRPRNVLKIPRVLTFNSQSMHQ